MKIRRNDIVVPLCGRDAGQEKSGKVLEVLPRKGRALVEGLNLVTKHLRKSQDNPKGGIVRKEALIALSNLALYCPQCKRGVRIGTALEGDRKVRKCKSCGHAFDT
jgi:large subunit ribosomal protein L24